MKEEKRHVGRPTNEEVRQRKNKKLFKFVSVFIVVIALILGIKNTNFNSGISAAAAKNNVCQLQLNPGNNKIDVQITCGQNAKPTALYIKNKNLSMRGKKFFNKSYGGVTNVTLKNINLGNQTITLKYQRKTNNKIYKLSKLTTVTSGTDIPFYNLTEEEMCKATPVLIENEKLKYDIECGKKAKLYNVVIWDNESSGSTEINYKKKTEYKYGENTTEVCGKGCYNIKEDNTYHIRLYWRTDDVTEKTGLNLYVKSTGSFNKESILGKNKLKSSSETTTVATTTIKKTTTKTTTTTTVKTTKKTTKSNNQYIKILMVGNSYTYYNGYGQMLAKLARKTGKKVIVVRATRGGYGANALATTNEISYVAWSSTNGTIASGSNKTLDQVSNIDFGNLNRKDKWDYVILQNNDSKESIVKGDTKIYNKFKNKIPNSKNFIINATHYSTSVSNARYEYHLKMAKQYKVSVINTARLFAGYEKLYNRDWKSDLTIKDSNYHQSGRGGYIYALAIYARIFGVNEFASSTTDNTFIKLYNSNGGKTSEFAPNKFSIKNGSPKSYTVDASAAKKLQYLVRKYYKAHVLAY